MGAYGAALIARDAVSSHHRTCFKGFDNLNHVFSAESFTCSGCDNMCEVVRIKADGICIAHWGDRCGKWDMKPLDEADENVCKEPETSFS